MTCMAVRSRRGGEGGYSIGDMYSISCIRSRMPIDLRVPAMPGRSISDWEGRGWYHRSQTDLNKNVHAKITSFPGVLVL